MTDAADDGLVLINVQLADWLAHVAQLIGSAGVQANALTLGLYAGTSPRSDAKQLLNLARNLEDAGTQLARIAANWDALQTDMLRDAMNDALHRMMLGDADKDEDV